MKSRYLLKSKHPDAGFGLIELMIAIAISLMVVLAISSLFLGQKKSYSTQDDLSKLQEGGRFLVQEMSRTARHAGYRDVLSAVGFAGADFLTGIEGVGSTGVAASDSFTVRFFGSSNPAALGVADGSMIDCQGNAIARDTLVVQTYSIANVNGAPSLVCAIGAGAPVLLLPDVESMQILYGEDGDDDGSVDRFRPASTATMGLVKSMMFSVVLRTNAANHTEARVNTFNHFGLDYAPGNVAPAGDPGAVYTSADDRRLRRQYVFSVGLRNRLD